MDTQAKAVLFIALTRAKFCNVIFYKEYLSNLIAYRGMSYLR